MGRPRLNRSRSCREPELQEERRDAADATGPRFRVSEGPDISSLRTISRRQMETSKDRILTTHVGSLPRPQDVVDVLFAQDRGEAIDQAEFDRVVGNAVKETVRLQVDAGLDVIDDGEMSKISYATYIRHRLTGFEGDSQRPTPQDLDDYPEYRDRLVKAGHSATYKRPVCRGPVKVKDLTPVEHDIARMKSAMAKAGIAEGFLNSV